MNINYIKDVRNTFIGMKVSDDFTSDGMLEIKNASFVCTEPSIFGTPNEEYIKAEIEWYESESLNVYDLFEIYGKPVKIWNDVSDIVGGINSNYGWCIHSDENGQQYNRVLLELLNNRKSRRASMYYTRPTMHTDAVKSCMNDHMCTYAVNYRISEGGKYLETSVMMRSNDAVFGFNNDLAWQKHVAQSLADDIGIEIGPIHWFANSLHVYPRHIELVK